jgi:hypothetical protein
MMLKYLIPFDRFTIRSPLSAAEAIDAVKGVVEPRKLRIFGGGEKAFEGEVEPGRFRIATLVSHRRSFQLVIAGEMTEAPDGSHISVSMRLTNFLLTFCAISLTLGLFLIGTLLTAYGFNALALVPLGGLAFNALIINGGFWFEANKQRKMLTAVFNGRGAELEGEA